MIGCERFKFFIFFCFPCMPLLLLFRNSLRASSALRSISVACKRSKLTLSGLTNGQFPHRPVHTRACSVLLIRSLFSKCHICLCLLRGPPLPGTPSAVRRSYFKGISRWWCGVAFAGLPYPSLYLLTQPSPFFALLCLCTTSLFPLKKEGVRENVLLGWNRI